MYPMRCSAAVLILLGAVGLRIHGQQRSSSAPLSPVVSPTAAAPVLAATVNGQPISENAVQRGLKRIPLDQWEQARQAILDFLIDNLLLDQYLAQHGVAVERKEVESKVQQVREEIKQNNKSFEQLLNELMTTDQEFRAYVEAQIRWDRFANQQATDEALLQLFKAEREIFDGTMVRARHILLSPATDDPQASEKAMNDLALWKKQIEERVKQDLAKLPPETDAAAQEKARCRSLEDAFSEYARKYSSCSTKDQGGDVDWFPRAGHMVEAFSKAAFALKPYQLSEIVKTPFGYHLILVTERRAGLETKFEDVKVEVKDVYCARLRENICAKMRPSAKIAISPPTKQ